MEDDLNKQKMEDDLNKKMEDNLGKKWPKQIIGRQTNKPKST